jgi:V8-like Glu-specific endopeptidase
MKALTFIGERNAPDSLEKVQARRPILGSGERPKELLELAARRSWYMDAPHGEKPTVSISRANVGERQMWRIDAPLDPHLGGAIPGISAERRPAAAFLEETDEKVSIASYRPEWADALYTPRRSLVVDPLPLRRFNGRRVRPLWVFGNDDRWQFRDASWPWGLVGRIFNNQGYSGTGALVGNRLVVTAGHMVPWSSSSWWMRFVPAYYDGSSLHGAGVESHVSHARGYDTGSVAGYDWAILRLYEPLGTSLGYYGYNGYSDSWNDHPLWSIIGYPGAIANAQRPSFQGGITVGDTDGDSNGGEELESDTADITPGDSGGPMFAWWGGDPRIVGVVSGEEEYSFLGITFDQDNIMAAGSGFTGLISWGRSNWP